MLFNFDGNDVRVVVRDDEPWFLLTDPAKVLGYRDAADAKRLLRDGQYNTLSSRIWSDLGGRGRPPIIVTEGGLYRLIMRSDSPVADSFQDWVTDEVLPAIRKTGKYDRFDPENQTDLLVASEQLLNALSNEVKKLRPKAEVRDAVYNKKDGYTRSHIHALALEKLGIKASLPEFNKLLMVLGVTVPCGKQFNVSPDYYELSNDPTYFNHSVGSNLPNNNPHFTEEGKDRILSMIGDLLKSREGSDV